MTHTIYLDNSATTPLSEVAKAAMCEAMECYGNPSSLHKLGQEAHSMLETARKRIAASLGVRSLSDTRRILFTSCGSESDNLAILGTAYAKPRRRGGRIITTDSEHAGVENAMKALEKDGFEVVRIPTRGGVLDLDALEDALTPRTFLISLMSVNNETGAQYDVGRAFAMAKAKNPDIVTHTDAVQAYLKCRLSPVALGADLVTVSAHKIHGPKGVGALYVSPEALKRRDIVPLLLGGGQENGFRSGTENLVGIVGFGAAAQEGFSTLAASVQHMTELRDYARERLSALPVRLNLPKGASAPHIVNLTLPDVRSETMLHALSADGIFVSNGSACSSHSHDLSAALTAFGLTPAEIECSIRISFGVQNTREDVDALAASLESAIARLVKIHR
ncbi:MAG: cysteine desulfurase [Clostridia bacterium]|nr:cysteine desulfurase [Clostridia bacterium]